LPRQRLARGRFFFFNISGGICWACLFGFGSYAIGTEILQDFWSVESNIAGLFIAVGFALSIFIRRYEIALRGQASAPTDRYIS